MVNDMKLFTNWSCRVNRLSFVWELNSTRRSMRQEKASSIFKVENFDTTIILDEIYLALFATQDGEIFDK